MVAVVLMASTLWVVLQPARDIPVEIPLAGIDGQA
jgi:hypothetical protein